VVAGAGLDGGLLGQLAIVGAAFAFGVGSGVLPVILNAEVYVVGMGALVPHPFLLFAILSLAVGTVVGKAIVFELVRHGSTKVKGSVERKPPRNRLTRLIRRGGDRMLALLSHPHLGAATVLASSLTGIPPLAAVTVLAAASRQPLWLFLLMVGIGRTAQFLALAYLVHQIRF
jgi:membrane protein YqaA with SNARE-associated domain